jgi:hypothetical protein
MGVGTTLLAWTCETSGRKRAIAESRMATIEISTMKLVRWETCPLPVTLNATPFLLDGDGMAGPDGPV